MDLWYGNVINSCNIRTKVVDLCDNLINNVKYVSLLLNLNMFYLKYYKICFVLAKKNIYKTRNLSFILTIYIGLVIT